MELSEEMRAFVDRVVLEVEMKGGHQLVLQGKIDEESRRELRRYVALRYPQILVAFRGEPLPEGWQWP